MGRLTQMIDYLNRKPEDFSLEYVKHNYTHFIIDDVAKKTRIKNRYYNFMPKRDYTISFNFKKDLEKSIMVQKKTKTINKVFFIPKSVIIEKRIYDLEKKLDKDVSYKTKRIELVLPKWYCDKELKFYK